MESKGPTHEENFSLPELGSLFPYKKYYFLFLIHVRGKRNKKNARTWQFNFKLDNDIYDRAIHQLT